MSGVRLSYSPPYVPIDKWPKSSAFHAEVTGSNPVRDTKYSSLAQSVEHLTVNQRVVGSSPTGGASRRHATRALSTAQKDACIDGSMV